MAREQALRDEALQEKSQVLKDCDELRKEVQELRVLVSICSLNDYYALMYLSLLLRFKARHGKGESSIAPSRRARQGRARAAAGD
jgi:hypothetical protein